MRRIRPCRIAVSSVTIHYIEYDYPVSMLCRGTALHLHPLTNSDFSHGRTNIRSANTQLVTQQARNPNAAPATMDIQILPLI
jgi:hypothetical protein